MLLFSDKIHFKSLILETLQIHYLDIVSGSELAGKNGLVTNLGNIGIVFSNKLFRRPFFFDASDLSHKRKLLYKKKVSYIMEFLLLSKRMRMRYRNTPM